MTASCDQKRASLFCAIAVALSIVPLTGAYAQRGNGAAVIGPTASSTPYGCSSAGVQQAIKDAISHANGITQSVVDASNCTSMITNGTNYYTSEIDVGTFDPSLGYCTNPNDPNQRIKLILPANGTWTAAINDSSKYALRWCKGAMIYGGTGSGEGQPFTITAGSTANLYAVCGNDPTYGSYYHAEGFSCSASTGATIQSAVMEINFTQDESYVGHVNAASWGAHTSRVLWIHAACCSATFEDINAEAFYSANTVPCVFGDGNEAIHISKVSCVHPGSGKSAVQIFQSGSAVNNGVGSSYKDIYVEEGNNGDTTGTAYVAVSHYSGTFAAADLLDGLRADVDATGSTTRCMVDIGLGSRVNIANLSLGSTSTCAIHDEVNNVTLNGAKNSVIASYDMTPRYGLTLGTFTVSSLPSATTNAGTMFRVTDSTAITAEGQTCVGGGTNTALAFSSGSVWKCF